MTGLDRTFSKVTLEEKKDRRSLHEEIRKRFNTALADLSTVTSVNHTDPHAALEDLHNVLQFSSVPKEYRARKPTAPNGGGSAESIVKHNMKNDEYNHLVSGRSASTPASAAAAPTNVVDVNRPLPLSFEHRRSRIMKTHTSRVESSLSGLFSKNVNGVPQGPVPDLYNPPASSRRSEIEASKAEAQSQRIKNTRVLKETLLTPKNPPQLLGKKVQKDFVPNCFLNAVAGDGKAQVQQRQLEKHSRIAGVAPFK